MCQFARVKYLIPYRNLRSYLRARSRGQQPSQSYHSATVGPRRAFRRRRYLYPRFRQLDPLGEPLARKHVRIVGPLEFCLVEECPQLKWLELIGRGVGEGYEWLSWA